MGLDLHTEPPWLATVLLAEDDTEESVMGSDLHQEAREAAEGQAARAQRELEAAQAELARLRAQQEP